MLLEAQTLRLVTRREVDDSWEGGVHVGQNEDFDGFSGPPLICMHASVTHGYHVSRVSKEGNSTFGTLYAISRLSDLDL